MIHSNIKSNYRSMKIHFEIIMILITIIMILNLLSPQSNAEPFNCEVTITMDEHEVEYIINPKKLLYQKKVVIAIFCNC